MAVINSNSYNLVVKKVEDDDYQAFALSTDASIGFTHDLVEATLGVTNGWAEFIKGKRTATVSFSGLQDYDTIANRHNVLDLGDFLLDEELLDFRIGSGDNVQIGQGYVSEITLDGSSDDVARYSGVLTLVGDLTQDAEVVFDVLRDTTGDPIIDDAGQFIYVPN